MKANELRIGNWAKYSFKQGIVDRISQDNCDIVTDNMIIKVSYDDLEPIPLTEEILLKCGFKERLFDWYELEYNTDYEEESEKMKIAYNCGSKRFAVYDANEEDYIAVFTAKRVHYLHQLQNLFYALTNEELQIEL